MYESRAGSRGLDEEERYRALGCGLPGDVECGADCDGGGNSSHGEHVLGGCYCSEGADEKCGRKMHVDRSYNGYDS